ncbi:uncharacterized protein LOC127733026 [Mytilus californianus]|uniref:uncharacterized protein LOC127733026 n=1 Tax=Mytilus californianus TaxID=6549 RepID=UPI0022457D39|nr:uncharacterized protein LOC127733026 [Mytilus californianus]
MAKSLQRFIENDFLRDLKSNLWSTAFIYLDIQGCNAHEFRNFLADTWVDFANNKEPKVVGKSLCELFRGAFIDLLVETQKQEGVDNIKQKTIQCLEDFLKAGDEVTFHSKCLQEMTTKSEKLKKEEIQAVLAVHLFTPLLFEGEVIADSLSYNSETSSKKNQNPEPECPFCIQHVKTGNTNFGCKRLWHGRADIVIKNRECRNVVKVASDWIENIEEGQCEPALKKARLDQDVEDLLDSNSFAEVEPSYIQDKAVHQLLFEREYMEAITQTIVNAFVAVKKNKQLENHLIPSFFVTTHCLFINFYNVSKDILLAQSKPLLFFQKGKINFDTIIALWMALNYEKLTVGSIDEDYKKSGLRKCLTELGVLDKYENEVESEFISAQKPMTTSGETDYYINIEKTFEILKEFKKKANLER